VEGAERFLEGGFGVVVVVVEDVDVVKSEAPQALIETCDQVFPRAEVAVGPRPHVPTGLGRDDELVAVVVQVLAEDPSEVGLGAAVRGSVVVGQVEMGDAQVEGPAHDGALGVEGPVVTEVLPQPERHGRRQEAAAPTTAVGRGPVAIFGGNVTSHVVGCSVLVLLTNLFDTAAIERREVNSQGYRPQAQDGCRRPPGVHGPRSQVRSGLRPSPFFLEGPGDDREVTLAEPALDDFLPFVGQAGKRPEAVVDSCL
jgi:hypothetical protein